MRKVKVVAALLCALTPGVLGGYRVDGAYSVKVSGQLRNDLLLLAEPATAAASIETTIVTSTTKPVTTSAADTTTTTEEETTTTATETLETEITTTETETTAAPLRTAPPVVAAAPAGSVKTTAARKTVTTTAAETEAASKETTVQEDGEDAAQTTASSKASEPGLPITQSEYIMLCNVVGHEYGANWISEYDKALVVEVIMNRVKSPKFPNTIYGVLTQKNQFSGLGKYINLGKFSYQVTSSVKAAVNLYFADPSRFNHGYLYFTGDGKRNYFRTHY